mmetsp:Transcript_79461/g.140250  ORF Transcript_79461/g.140250 Transcript_79461/m.140250 type:complete len:303 (-) Transcript_79461:650-1558(-)
MPLPRGLCRGFNHYRSTPIRVPGRAQLHRMVGVGFAVGTLVQSGPQGAALPALHLLGHAGAVVGAPVQLGALLLLPLLLALLPVDWPAVDVLHPLRGGPGLPLGAEVDAALGVEGPGAAEGVGALAVHHCLRRRGQRLVGHSGGSRPRRGVGGDRGGQPVALEVAKGGLWERGRIHAAAEGGEVGREVGPENWDNGGDQRPIRHLGGLIRKLGAADGGEGRHPLLLQGLRERATRGPHDVQLERLHRVPAPVPVQVRAASLQPMGSGVWDGLGIVAGHDACLRRALPDRVAVPGGVGLVGRW